MIKRRIIASIISVLLIIMCCAVIAEAENTPRLIVGQVSGNAGDTVTIQVSIENNPGIIAGSIKVEYDRTRLYCTSAALYGSFAKGATQSYNDSNFIFYFPQDNADNGVFLTLTFDILNTAKAGEATISISYERGNISNHSEEDIDPEVVTGKVTVINGSYIPGDFNGDGKINGKDGILCSQALAGWDVDYFELAADVNGDGKFNGKDGILLSQYLAGWDVVLG